MTAKLLGAYIPGSDQWHAARADRLGGSEVAAALGLSPWCSPLTLWHYKRGDIGPQAETAGMYWGRKHEPIILDEFTTRHPDLVVVVDGHTYTDGWRVATPDAWIGNKAGIVEAKTADAHTAWEWGPHGSDDPAAIPIYYRVQTLTYGDILDTHDLHLAVLIGGNDYREYRVPWDQGEVDLIRDRAEGFQLTLINDERPSIDGSDSTYQTIKELHPDIDGDDIEVPADIGRDYLETDLAHKATKAMAQQAKSRLLDAMGQARRALVAGEPIARRQPNGTGISLYPLHPKEAA